MPSKTQETKDSQKARYLKQMEARQASLKEKGIPEAAIAKDPKVKHYKAKIKQIKGATARISFLEEQTKQLAGEEGTAPSRGCSCESGNHSRRKKGERKEEGRGKTCSWQGKSERRSRGQGSGQGQTRHQEEGQVISLGSFQCHERVCHGDYRQAT